jgi:hypothetical protein
MCSLFSRVRARSASPAARSDDDALHLLNLTINNDSQARDLAFFFCEQARDLASCGSRPGKRVVR